MQPISPLFAVEAEKLIADGQISDAIELCRRGLELFPGYAAGVVALAKALAAAGDSKSANEELQNAFQESSGFKAFQTDLEVVHDIFSAVDPSESFRVIDVVGDEDAEQVAREDEMPEEIAFADEIPEETGSAPVEVKETVFEQDSAVVIDNEDEIPQSAQTAQFDETLFLEELDPAFVTEEANPGDIQIEIDVEHGFESAGPHIDEQDSEEEFPMDLEPPPIEVEDETEDVPKYFANDFDLISGLEFFRFEGKFRRNDYMRGLPLEAFDFRAPGDLDALASSLRNASVPPARRTPVDSFGEEPVKAPPFMTETIANLYVLQGELEQAREAFLRLAGSATSPEKSAEYLGKAEELRFQIEMRKANE
ncbi:MAG: tetratricopeptide repeat protein [Chloroflexota bacterium]